MKVTTKNGLKLDIRPKNWWNLMEWIWAFEQAEIIRSQDITMHKESWKFTFGTVTKV